MAFHMSGDVGGAAILTAAMMARSMVTGVVLMARMISSLHAVMIPGTQAIQRRDHSSQSLHGQHQEQGEKCDVSEPGKHAWLV